jgi:hypothetical protein
MQGQRRLAGMLGNLPDTRNDAVLFIFLLAVCLAYSVYTSVAYLTSFKLGIFDFAWRPIGRDFVNYWSAAVAVSDGMILQIFDASLFHSYQERLLGHIFAEHSWSYPPHMLLVIWPFGQLPYLWALAAWSFLGLGLYLWTSTSGRSEARILLVALLLAPATYENFSGGQNGFLTAVLLIGGFRLLGTRPIIAGILFGILTVKPQLGILLPFALLAARQWSAIAAASATALFLLGGSVLLFGWESWQAYIDLVIPQQAALMTEHSGIYLAMMPSAYMGLRLLEVEPWLRIAIQGIFLMVAVAGVVWAFARSKDPDLKFGVLAVGTFLASPYGFNYDMTTVSLAVAVVALRGLSHGFLPGERVALAMVWLLPTTIYWLNVNYLPLGPLILLACFGYFLARMRRPLLGEAGLGDLSGQSCERRAA